MTEINATLCHPQISFFNAPDPILLKMNRILGAVASAFKRDFAIGGHLRSYMVEAELKNVRMVSNVFPIGKIAEDMFGFEKSNNGVA